jgi:LuxR family maltose regulon positive regulatory protein
LEELDLHHFRPLTLVSAPAGYGKSVLISCWLESLDIPSAWLSLDKNDSSLHIFISYFFAAVETLFPGACRNTQEMLKAPDLPPMAALVNSLLNELGRIGQSFILVLDDYHLIKETVIHNLLINMLEYPPQSLHLVIIGRKDPPLAISTLRARSLVAEIRTQDLCFTKEETATFLNQLLRVQIDSTTVAVLDEKVEGWVTGLRLAVLSMRHRGNIDPKLLEAQVDAQYVMEYLFNEVFSLQPPEVSQYLLGTAILDRFCGPLCEAVCMPGAEPFTCEIGGWEFISWLKKENMFLIPLDAENRWFRFHHLFQKLLFNQLKRHFSSEDINALHAQASAWFAENGMIEEAFRHALAAGDVETAGSLVTRFGHDLMNDQQWPRLERLLGMLPRDHVEQDPQLLLFESWLLHIRISGINMLNMQTWLEKVETLLHSVPQKTSASATQMKGHFDALRGFQLFMSAEGENALKHTRSACRNIPIHHHRARAFAHIFQTGAYQMIGDLETGLSIFNKEMERSTKSTSNYYAMYLANLNFIYWIDADLVALRQNAERSLKIAMDSGQTEAIALCIYFLGIACYHQNNLQIAEEKLTTMAQDFYFHHPVAFAHSSFALSLIYQSKGKISKARKVCENLMNYAIDTNDQDLLLLARSFNAELSLRLGRLGEASHWAKRFHAKPFLPQYFFYMPQLVMIKVLMSQDTKDSQQQATDLLNQLNDFFESIHNRIFRIHVLALQALHYDTLGERPIALEKLAKALDLAEPGGFIRLFVDLGPQMADLLKQLIKQNVAMGYIGQILAAMREDEHKAMQDESEHIVTQSQPSSTQPLVEPLTNRELEILELVMQRLSNRDIAAKLFISIQTVKKHLSNIYGKLNVSKRWQAVEKAVALGILTRR